MLNRVEVVTEQGVLFTLPLDDISEGYSVQDIEGLDPVKAVLISSVFAQLDGEEYQSSRREKRNIKLTLGYEPDFVNSSVASLRRQLYSMFMPTMRVLLRFHQDGEPIVQIYGRVESFESPKFVKEPKAIISMLCFDPDFYDPSPVILKGTTSSSVLETTHRYQGSVETGFVFRLFANRAITEFSIHNRSADETLRSLEFQNIPGLIAGDTLTISTIPGNKYVTRTRAGIDTSYLFGVSPQSQWLELFPGQNALRVYAEGAAIPFEIEYTTKFGAL